MSNDDYNGWKNYETWNVNLWIQNDEGFYNHMVQELRDILDRHENDWENVSLAEVRGMVRDVIGSKTPDGVRTTDILIDWMEISDALLELAEGNNLQVRPDTVEEVDG
jgi:hypothetical protein